MRHLPRPLRFLPPLLATLPALATLAACDSGTLYRAGSENAPTGPGSWNGMDCAWDDRLVAQSSADDPSTPPSAGAPTLIAGDGDEALRAAATRAALTTIDRRARALKATVQWRTTCMLRCTANDTCNGNGFPLFGDTTCDEVLYDSAESADAGASSAGGQTGGAKEYSTTNNQVVGVDEADFLKNDAKYMHIASNGVVTSLDAFPGDAASILAKIAGTGTPRKLLATDTRLVVFSSDAPADSSRTECTYGYACVPTGDGFPTLVSVYDTTNRTAPRLLRTLQTSGSLLAARRIGDDVHLVVHDDSLNARLAALTGFSASVPSCVTSQADYDEAFATIDAAAARAKAAVANISSGIPTVTDSVGNASELRVYQPSRPSGDSFVSVVSFSLASNRAASRATIVGRPGFVYASADNVYLAQNESASDTCSGGPCGWYDGMNAAAATTVHAFHLGSNGAPTTYTASGIVPGTVLNSFALDEYAGHLRVATTLGRVPDPAVHSTLSVLEPRGSVLATVGSVDNIAPGEDIRSVRFDGDRGFVVTFKKTDPLFAFDLKDPSHPRLSGELKIPGFSTYIHPMDATHLLTIGYDADDHGSFAYFNGVQLQIFDISNLSNLRLVHKESIGTRGSSSEALTNHLAFTYFPQKNLLALPMTICEGGGNGQYGTNMTFNGLLVYDVTVASGFKKKGGIPLGQSANGGYDNSLCSSWWTDANTAVKRSVIMDDFVYSVSSSKVPVSRLSDLEHPVKELSLTR